VVAHDIASSMRVADRIAIFQERRIVELGTPEVIRASRDPFVQQFLHRQADDGAGQDREAVDYLSQ
jgi:phospholipid/cholesterol/gamma-HCH transport system ATP-binding protein